MARLADLLENYRNAVGRSTWNIGRDMDVMSGYDPDLAEFVEKSSLGTGGHGAGGLAGMIRASHGSPHAFTKFLMSKLGTGEGAQAYGHGMYFGEGFDSPVAQQYREALSGGAKKAVNASFSEDPELWAAGQLHSGINPSEVAEGLNILGYKGNPQELIKSAESRLKNELNAGNLYNVELRWPDAAREAADPLGEEHFLDWYAPLSQQPKSLQEKIGAGVLFDPEMTGQQVYEEIARQNLLKHGEGSNHAKAASDFFRESLGIPGIRYLDQGSRGTGTGTHNYVIFDENIPNIVSRNGVSLTDLLRR